MGIFWKHAYSSELLSRCLISISTVSMFGLRNPNKVGVCEMLTRLNWLYKFKERFQKAAEIFNYESIPHNKNCMYVSLIQSIIQ